MPLSRGTRRADFRHCSSRSSAAILFTNNLLRKPAQIRRISTGYRSIGDASLSFSLSPSLSPLPPSLLPPPRQNHGANPPGHAACRPEHRFDVIQTANPLALGDCHRKYSIAKHVSKRGALTFKTKTLTALRAVAGDECEVKEATSRREPADGNDRRDLAGPLVIKYMLCVYICIGPWPVVGCCRGGGKSKQQKTERLPSFWILRLIFVQLGHDRGG